ncbi:MAG: hypothetical protein AAFN77_12160 [Planctomycetota bacterium]
MISRTGAVVLVPITKGEQVPPNDIIKTEHPVVPVFGASAESTADFLNYFAARGETKNLGSAFNRVNTSIYFGDEVGSNMILSVIGKKIDDRPIVQTEHRPIEEAHTGDASDPLEVNAMTALLNVIKAHVLAKWEIKAARVSPFEKVWNEVVGNRLIPFQAKQAKDLLVHVRKCKANV